MRKKNTLNEIYDMFARLGMSEVKQPLNEMFEEEADQHRLVHKATPHQESEYFQPIKQPFLMFVIY